MQLKRLTRHLFTDHRSVRRAFPGEAMKRIQHLITEQERRHDGELRFVVEASLPLANLLRGQTTRERAIETFSRLGIWDTERNNGLLIYLLLADKAVEIVADRGLHAKVGDAAWESLCGEMRRSFDAGRFEDGICGGVRAAGDLLSMHFLPMEGGSNELPDEPVIA